MQRIANHFFVLFLGIAGALPLLAEDAGIDWPTFQGNIARTGASDYPAITTPEIAWSTQVGIMGYLNCPVIDGDSVFVTSSGDTHNKPDKRDGVYCLDLKTGEILWQLRTPIDACGITIDKTLVYVGDDNGGFHAIDRKTGERKWLYEFNASVYGPPLRVSDMILAGGADGMVVAFDPATGKKQWSFHHDDAIRAGMSSDGKHIFAVYLHGRVVCFDLKGKVLWQRDALDAPDGEFERREIYNTPTVGEDAVYFGFARDTYYDSPPLSSIRKDGLFMWITDPDQPSDLTDEGEVERHSHGNIRSSPALWRDHLLFGETYGNKVAWARTFDGMVVKRYRCGAEMFPHWPSPVIAGEMMYLARHDGGLYAIDAPQNHNQPWMVYLGSHKQAKVNAMPQAFAHFNRTDWKPPVGKPIYATPAIAKDGTLVIGSGEGWLYCIREAE